MWPGYSLRKELRQARRGRFGDAWREKETHEGLATEATFSSNGDFRETWVGSNLESRRWGLSLRGGALFSEWATAPLRVHLFSRHCRKAGTENTQHLRTSGAPHAAQKGKQRPKRKEVYARRSQDHRGQPRAAG